ILTASFATVAIGELNIISIAFAVLYIGLGVDFAIHFLLRYQEKLENGLPIEAAIRRSGGEVGIALASCTVANAIGFYAFIPTNYSGVAELGIIAGTGMLVSLLVTFIVGPALLSYLTKSLVTKVDNGKTFVKLLSISLKWKKPINVAAILMLLLAVIA